MPSHPLRFHRPDRPAGSTSAREADPPDERLMLAIRQGEEDALGVLMERYWPPLFQYAFGRMGRADEAEDVTQEVFIRVWKSRHSWEGGGSTRAFLYRIAKNLMLDRFRHGQVKEDALPRVARATARPETPVDTIEHTELREAFEAALSALPPRRREAFLLVRFQGLSLKEAGEVMELTARTVANHIYLAATDLEESLRPFLT